MTDASLTNDRLTAADIDRMAVDVAPAEPGTWSPRKILFFVVGASGLAWTAILLPFMIHL